jgi:hypothetical protein
MEDFFKEFWEGTKGGSKDISSVIFTILEKTLKLLFFFVLALFFIPSYLIVTNFNKLWSTLLKDLFGL